MKNIKMRTKAEITIGIVAIIILASVSVLSVTRTISDTSDDIDTFVRNSNGKYWECTETNIQAAIDDLSGSGWKGGTVWVPGDQEISINTGLVLEDFCILDLGGSYLDAKADVNVVTMKEGSTLRNGQIDTRDASVGTFTKAAVFFDCAENYYMVTKVHDMTLFGENSEGAGIRYLADAQGEKASFTICTDIWIYEFGEGIVLNCSGGANSGALTYINSNIFSNIHLIGNKYQIRLDRNTAVNHGQCDVDGNIFDTVTIQTAASTERSIYAEGRYNRFTGIVTWDWGNATGAYSYEFTSDTSQFYLEFFGGSDNLSNGGGTTNTIFDTGTGTLVLLTYNQAGEPDIPNNSIAFWCDTDAGPTYYLIKKFGSGLKKVEMT